MYSVNGNGSVACFEASENIKNYAEKYKCNVARAVRLVIETNSVEIHGNCFNGRENERTREREGERKTIRFGMLDESFETVTRGAKETGKLH